MLYPLNLILNSNQDVPFFRNPSRLLGFVDTKICKNRIIKISFFSYLMLGYISPIINSLQLLL